MHRKKYAHRKNMHTEKKHAHRKKTLLDFFMGSIGHQSINQSINQLLKMSHPLAQILDLESVPCLL